MRIRRAQQARRLYRNAAGDDRATSADAARFRYLDALDDADDGRAISEIARAIDVDRPRASRLTRELLDAGLIERESRPGDSRYARIRLTARGREVVNEVRATRTAAVAHALAEFTEQEARTFAELLERFVAAWPARDAEGE
ncbi:DNA-binding MarR family transcriptional regulator [Paramicrobacterium agarici]|uniref:DNA-binding MarR family transcriptional regulator n=1 Tax=Paramicrobacterium agarici TaxID=630514 RepID=A0A2A9E018_9MICO|nr:DNA-binding MarR family transcriptional regulator [Microbacterium agarici]